MTASGPLYASIDIGTNSALLLIAAVGAETATHGPGTAASGSPGARPGTPPSGSSAAGNAGVGSAALEPVLQRVAVPRVGRGLSATGRISDESFSALMAALSGFLAEIRKAGARLTGAVATEAFRKAQNGPALLAQVSAALGCECRILPGEEESRLGYLAVSNRHPLPDLAVLDVGGGSTETTTAFGGTSLPIGAVALLEACGHKAEACRDKALEAIRGLFAGAAEGGAPWSARRPPEHLVAVGGTATALAMLEKDMTVFDSAAIEGAEFSRDAVTRQIARLESLSESERAALPGLGPGRADILMPGLCILESFLAVSGRTRFRVSDRGIRYGVILDWLAKHAAEKA